MIGNLLLLACTALLGASIATPLCSSPSVDYSMANPSRRVSSVNNALYDVYGDTGDYGLIPTDNSDDLYLDTIYGNGDLYGVDDSIVYDDSSEFIGNQFEGNFSNTSNIYVCHCDINVGASQYKLLRFYVPTSLNFSSIEFDLEGELFSVGYGDYRVGLLLAQNVNKAIINNSNFLEVPYNEYTPTGFFNFFNYYFLFPLYVHDDVIQYCDWYFMNLVSPDSSTAYSQGFNDGYANGFDAGSASGYQSGYTEGNSAGYASGYADGLAFASGASFNNLFGAIADTPVIFLRNLFGFELFGMNVFAIIMSLITGIVLIYVIKKVWK